jgi:DNA-directed RNA polymerase beta' subunit
LANRNQQIVNDLYQAILESLSNKEGFIRGSLVGSRMNLSSRCVIGPLSGEYGMDECVLPYQAALELMKPMLIRKIMKIKRVAASEAHRQWFKASQSYNRFIHTLMRDIAKNENVRILLNRNPTISVGSILALRIADVKADMDDFTLNINNLILPSLSGDYDGDVLNILLIVSKAFVEFFDRFRPSNLVMDCETGRFNRNFGAFKDIALGLETVANL